MMETVYYDLLCDGCGAALLGGKPSGESLFQVRRRAKTEHGWARRHLHEGVFDLCPLCDMALAGLRAALPWHQLVTRVALNDLRRMRHGHG